MRARELAPSAAPTSASRDASTDTAITRTTTSARDSVADRGLVVDDEATQLPSDGERRRVD